MPRDFRQLSISGIYHIMNRGINGQQIFEDDLDCITFLEILNNILDDDFNLYAYVLMGNHFHLLLRIPLGEKGLTILTNKMKTLGSAYVPYFNKRYYRRGILFENRFKSLPVHTKSYYYRLLRYIHNNPVLVKLSEDMASYKFSSYGDYFTEKKSICNVDTQYTYSFTDKTKLLEFHSENESNYKDFKDIDDKEVYLTDKDASELVCKTLNIKVPNEISNMDKPSRDEAIAKICILPISMRCISRITGVSHGVIKRVKLRLENGEV